MPPFLLVFAGPNGSGKSSLVAQLLREGYDLGDHINPDDIAAQLQGSYEERVRKAQDIADNRRADALAARRSFSFETVFSHPSKLDVMHQARDGGFVVTLFFIALDSPEKNVLRVRTRVQSGGHDVPPDRIVARYARTLGLLPAMVEAAHRSYIFDNSALYGGPDGVRRLVAVAEFDGQVVISVAAEMPAWVNHYLVKPGQERGWQISPQLR